jgi:hypothetical protein
MSKTPSPPGAKPVKTIPPTIEERIARLRQLNRMKQAIYRHAIDIIEKGYRKRNSLKQIVQSLIRNKLGIAEWELERGLKQKVLNLYRKKLEIADDVREAGGMAFFELVREDEAEIAALQQALAEVEQGETKKSGEGIKKRKKRTRKRKRSKRKRGKGKKSKKNRRGTKKRSSKRRR